MRQALATDPATECVLVGCGGLLRLPHDLLRNGPRDQSSENVTHHCASPPSGLLNAVNRPVLIPSNAPGGNFPCANAVTNKARATHDHSQEWVANDRWSCLKGRLPPPSWTISHTVRTTLRPIRNVQVELPELFRTTSLEEGEGASLDHAGPEASPLCQASSERLPMPVAQRTTLPTVRARVPCQPGNSTHTSCCRLCIQM